MAADEIAKERPRCPFYGFSFTHNILMDQMGNRCACVRESFSPCYIESERREAPNWDICKYNTPEVKQRMTTQREQAENVRVFPDELRPSGGDNWEGISFSEWYECVMGRPL
ncbi:hypothetical protein HYW74_00970 [Candidatus Pacearchaeota archaeon]|nr:hypothetical protein [Candidatus Pacearchaeota archaeon]